MSCRLLPQFKLRVTFKPDSCGGRTAAAKRSPSYTNIPRPVVPRVNSWLGATRRVLKDAPTGCPSGLVAPAPSRGFSRGTKARGANSTTSNYPVFKGPATL